MEHSLFEARFYETYYFTTAVRNILHDQFAFLRPLDDFYGDNQCLSLIEPFRKYSAFHCFINFVVNDLLHESIDGPELQRRQNELKQFSSMAIAISDLKPQVLPVEEAFTYYEMTYLSFIDWLNERKRTFMQATFDDVDEYYDYLKVEGPFQDLLDRSVDETFFILFQNRQLMLIFNEMISRQLQAMDLGEVPDENQSLFSAAGVLKRQEIPKWAQRAVFYRDRGICVICHCDLSGMLNIGNRVHCDHMVPLAQGGLNDVSNLQLLCQDCNLKKASKDAKTSDYYETWYPMIENEK
jgi:hypothetical protein